MTRLCLYLALLLAFLPEAFAQENLRIRATELATQMKESRLVVIDARPAAEYQKGHLPGARNIPFLDTFENFSASGRVVSLNKAQSVFSAAGLKRDDILVIYDAGPMLQAARVMWTLDVYGHPRVRLLDGGLKSWQSAGLPISQEAANPPPSNYVPGINPKRLATRLSTLAASHTPAAYVILDAREAPHYEGRESEAQRFGHIPKAIGIPSSKNLAGDGIHLKSRDELAKVYGDIPRDKKVIIYCSVGIASSLEYLVLRDLGYDVANYDASWKEWGNDPSLPIRAPLAGGEIKRQ